MKSREAKAPIVPPVKGTYKIHHLGEIPFYRKINIKIGQKIKTLEKITTNLLPCSRENFQDYILNFSINSALAGLTILPKSLASL